MIPSTAFDKFNSLMILILLDTDSYRPIPESMARLPNLRILYLNQNRLNGPIPPFDKEIVWRMRRKLKLENNLRLCYNSRNGFGVNLGLLSDSGIYHCDMPRTGLAQMVQHIATTIHNRSHSFIGPSPRYFLSKSLTFHHEFDLESSGEEDDIIKVEKVR
ncbi:hypothetical protein L2E82_44192 [Cichorium intybus]|uniref:Uncharacterized protein n=1 Tax=Cichorium intybus TaxID=13427 RepID=A0ACB8ZPG9_CICIN|nr:hypothetical protein L2E82_44192 [Cichorium intybus]